MRTYALENRGRAPLYEYLYRCIRGDILDGTLTAGERLASTWLLFRSSRQTGASGGASGAGGAGTAGRGRSTSATKKPRLGWVYT